MINSIYISIIGIVYLLLLFVPNIIWTKYQPIGYENSHENKFWLFVKGLDKFLSRLFQL